MTFFPAFPCRLLSAVVLALACAVPHTYAVELEGTVVAIDAPVPVQVQVETPVPVAPSADAPAPEGALTPPPKDSSEYQQWLQEHKDYAREQEDYAREQADHAREMQTQKYDHQNWEHNWEKNLSQAFGGNHDAGDFHPALLIPILAILFIFGGPIILLILILMFFFGSKRRRQQDINMNIDKLLAAGRDIPIELLRGDEPKRDEPAGSRDRGIRNIFLGTGWLCFLTFMVGFNLGSAGFIWIALGASQVLIWYLNQPNTTGQAGQQD